MAGPEAISSRDSIGIQKTPPHSIEAEEALLGSALLSRDASNRLMEEIKSQDFYSPTNQTIFDAMKELFDSGKPIDSVTVSEVVFKDKKNTTNLKTSTIAQLVDNVPSSANFERGTAPQSAQSVPKSQYEMPPLLPSSHSVSLA